MNKFTIIPAGTDLNNKLNTEPGAPRLKFIQCINGDNYVAITVDDHPNEIVATPRILLYDYMHNIIRYDSSLFIFSEDRCIEMLAMGRDGIVGKREISNGIL